MSDLIQRAANFLMQHLEPELCNAVIAQADEIERLRAVLDAEARNRQRILDEVETENAKLQAVVDAAKHLLAGGDKEAVYHLEQALAALEEMGS